MNINSPYKVTSTSELVSLLAKGAPVLGLTPSTEEVLNATYFYDEIWEYSSTHAVELDISNTIPGVLLDVEHKDICPSHSYLCRFYGMKPETPKGAVDIDVVYFACAVVTLYKSTGLGSCIVTCGDQQVIANLDNPSSMLLGCSHPEGMYLKVQQQGLVSEILTGAEFRLRKGNGKLGNYIVVRTEEEV